MLTISRPAAIASAQESALLQAKDIFEGMTEPFFDILLESRVIVNKARKIHSGFLVIDDNSRIQTKVS